jgi:hypothetical protein
MFKFWFQFKLVDYGAVAGTAGIVVGLVLGCGEKIRKGLELASNPTILPWLLSQEVELYPASPG